MRSRDYKTFSKGAIFHIYNRGNNREKIFLNEEDYKAFLFRISLALGIEPEIVRKEKLLLVPHSRIRISGNKNFYKLHAFCLMPNHFHLLVEQIGDTPISKLISQICTSYAMYINKKYERVGHVFQDQFKSVLIENNPQLMWVSSYIHMNPVKDGLVTHPKKHKWSSYCDFTEKRNLPITCTEFLPSIFDGDFEKQTLAYDSVKDAP